ncbi:hypothetical protein Cgig2_000618 [Carnegiea gigantea]|uniref:Uncharacterized protein n=1 Tax=Carnegiea gigantea TaxID=171969 RepID=A0A9Q1GIM9_9CARY|nr:hypothetical protein Cgig2_000618 [Carnegiea gigantea]
MSWTKESLTSRSALIKLAEDRAEREEAPPATGVAVSVALEIVGCPGRAGVRSLDDGFSTGEPPVGRSSLPSLARGHRPWSCQVAPWSSTSYGQTNSRRAFSHRVQGMAPAGRSFVSVSKKTKGGKASKGHIPYLFGLLSNKKLPLFLSLMLSNGRHLFKSGVPGLKHCQLGPCLICMKQIGSQDKKASRSEKEVVCKKLQFREPNIKYRAVRRSFAVGSPKGLRTGFPSFQSGTSPQPESRHRKRKSYFQYFSFDFFSMAVMKPSPLLKQYHPRSPVSFGAF